jgi:hypothetical protein
MSTLLGEEGVYRLEVGVSHNDLQSWQRTTAITAQTSHFKAASNRRANTHWCKEPQIATNEQNLDRMYKTLKSRIYLL